MKPWETLEAATTPDGGRFELCRRDGNYVIQADGYIEREMSDQRQIIINGRYMREITQDAIETLREQNRDEHRL